MMLTISHRSRTDIRDIIVTEAGVDLTNLITQNMTTDSNLSLANRKQLADLLKKYEPLHEKAREKYRARRGELQQSLLHQYLVDVEGSQFVAELAAAEKSIDTIEERLNLLGLELDGGELSLSWGAQQSLKDRINKSLTRAIGDENDIDARFDSARLALMTVPTLEDAKKIIDSVSELTK